MHCYQGVYSGIILEIFICSTEFMVHQRSFKREGKLN